MRKITFSVYDFMEQFPARDSTREYGEGRGNGEAPNKITDRMVAELQLPLPRQLLLISHEIEGAVIPRRPEDGYVNATVLRKAAGKERSNYRQNASYQEPSKNAAYPFFYAE